MIDLVMGMVKEGGALLWFLATGITLLLLRKIGNNSIYDYSGKPYISIKAFSMNNKNGDIVKIEARTAGIFGWFTSIIGLDTQHLYRVTKNQVIYSGQNLVGNLNVVAPLKHATGTRVGWARSFTLLKIGVTGLGLAILMKIFGLLPGTIFFLPILSSSAILILFYFTKRILLVIDITDSIPFWLVFSEGDFEGISISEDTMLQVASVIDDAILKAK